MGSELFGVDIAGIIADNMAGQLFAVTVTRYTDGDRDGDNLTGGRPRTPATVTGIDGFWEDFTRDPPPGVEVELGDRKAVLIGDSIPAGGHPKKNDQITIEGETLWMVQLISRDPVSAVYTYLCRDRGPDPVEE
jgi:hypothetical protein